MTLTQDRVHTLLDYNADTGELTWVFNNYRPDRIGQRAGWFDSSVGYWKIAIDGSSYMAARIIWLWVHGELPRTVDHEDTDKANDRLYNLRNVTKAQNAANSKVNCRNTTGFKGVSISNGRYRADISVDGIHRDLGRYDTPEEAHAAWYTAAVEAWGEEFVRAA